MNTVTTVVVLLVIGGFVWNHIRNCPSFEGFGNVGGGKKKVAPKKKAAPKKKTGRKKTKNMEEKNKHDILI